MAVYSLCFMFKWKNQYVITRNSMCFLSSMQPSLSQTFRPKFHAVCLVTEEAGGTVFIVPLTSLGHWWCGIRPRAPPLLSFPWDVICPGWCGEVTTSWLHFVIVNEFLSALRKISGFIKNSSKATRRRRGDVKVCLLLSLCPLACGEKRWKKGKVLCRVNLLTELPLSWILIVYFYIKYICDGSFYKLTD